MTDATPEAFYRAQFEMSDLFRRALGHAFEASGLGPSECPYRITASGPFWRLRDYGYSSSAPSLLIVAAPIKKPYIWDLSSSTSAIRYCMRHGLHVHLLEWLPASHGTDNAGLAEYTEAIDGCVARLSDPNAGAKPFVAGHSLGGTLVALFAALAPASIRGLVLLGAPVCFQPGTSRFRDALVSLLPRPLSETEIWPGALLSHVSALASPETFIWSRLVDAAWSLADGHAMEIHARVERWALDEASLPGKLVHQLVEWLYRENRFCRGEMMLGGRRIGPRSVTAPTLITVNTADDIAPLGSVKPFVGLLSTKDACVIEHPGETGVCLQHLGVLIGQQARAHVWPKIISWISAHC